MRRTAYAMRAAAAIALLLASDAQGTRIEHRTPRQMGAGSALVVQGRVAGIRSYWNGTRTKILTETRISVDRSLKGDAEGEVAVIQLGGTVGHVRMRVEGAVSWERGEEVLLFLEPFRPGSYQVYGLSLGKYRVERDGRGRAFVRGAGHGAAEPLGAPEREGDSRVPLDLFINDALDGRM
ncbi:MAG: hypothetical protein PHQ19_07200 [Candidatus Krumholzibacteria bacterium]|nr:hypothetical protein [Candidatus Krumholzibacteria bacterium]